MRCHVLLVAAIVAWSSTAAAETSVQVGVGTSSFQFDFLYSDYGVQPVQVQHAVACVGEPDLLVALQLAQVTGFDIDVIIDWRRGGLSWDAITRNCHRDALVYYVELPADVSGPPYGRAHGYWKKHGKRDLQLSDAEIRELVLVQALAKHCKTTPAQVVRSRVAGRSPRAIAGVGNGASRSSEDAAPSAPAASGRAKGKGKAKAKSGH